MNLGMSRMRYQPIFTQAMQVILMKMAIYISWGVSSKLLSAVLGRNISPEWVESNSLSEPEIQQIAVFGEAQPSLSAVIYAEEHRSDAQLAAAIYRANTRMPDYAQIKNCVPC